MIYVPWSDLIQHRVVTTANLSSHIRGLDAHLTPTSRKRKRMNNDDRNCTLQGRYIVCRNAKKAKRICSKCHDNTAKDFFHMT